MQRDHKGSRLVTFLFSLLLPMGIVVGWIRSDSMDNWIVHGTWWVLFVSFFAWICGNLLLVWRCRHRWTQILINHRTGLTIVVFASLFLHVHDPHVLKILPSEHEIGSTARSQLLYRELSVLDVAFTQGRLSARVQSHASRQAPLFPWLLSAVHIMTGFRYQNVFFLNGFLSLVTCGLLYSVVSQWMGSRYGKLSVLLLIGLPLMHEVASGGGAEVLHLSLVLCMLWFSRRCLDDGSRVHWVLLLLTGFLLSCASVQGLLLSGFPFLIMVLRRREGRCSSWIWWITPVLWIFPASIYAPDLYTFSLPNIAQAISRLGDTILFLFDTTRSYGNSPFLSAIGLVSILFWTVHLVRDRRRAQERVAHEWLMFALVVVVGLVSVLSVVASVGGWSNPAASRGSLTLYLIVTVLASYVMRFGFRLVSFPKTLLVIPVIAAISINGSWNHWGDPSRIRDPESVGLRYLDKEFLSSWPQHRDSLYIGEGAKGAILRGWSAMPLEFANQIPERIAMLLSIGFFRDAYVGEFISDVPFGVGRSSPSARFILEPMFDRPIRDGLAFRISRLVGISDPVPGGETLPHFLPLPCPKNGSSQEEVSKYMGHLLYEYADTPKDER